MRKWLTAIILGVLALVLFSYFIIPGSFSIHESKKIPVNSKSLQRVMLDDTNWARWWPGEKTIVNGAPVLTYNGYTYTITDKKLTTTVFSITKEDFSTSAVLNFIPVDNNATQFSWVVEKPVSPLPVPRLKAFFISNHLERDLNVLLERMNTFFSNTDNIYNAPIRKALVVDSILLSTQASTKGYPTYEAIYALIDKLKTYTASQGAAQTGNPMLNVFTKDSITYLIKVAIPVNKRLKAHDGMEYRWMLGGGNILITEVKGGPAAIATTYRQIEKYISDHQRAAPAIPFESLVTDRRAVKDTAQWITRIYYPVM